MKDTRLQIRVTQAEKKSLAIRAEKIGSTVSNLVRVAAGLPASDSKH